MSKVIAQSGSALADWAVIVDKYRAQNTSRVYAKTLGCSIESSWKLVQCLKDGRSFLDLGNSEMKPDVGTFPWAPVLDMNFTVPRDNYYEDWRASDWHFFTETPEESIRARKYRRDLAYMTGVTTQEAAFMICEYLQFQFFVCFCFKYYIFLLINFCADNNATLARNQHIIDAEMFDQKVWELVLRYNYTLNPEGVYSAIKYMYTYWPDPNNVTHIREQYINVSGFIYTIRLGDFPTTV